MIPYRNLVLMYISLVLDYVWDFGDKNLSSILIYEFWQNLDERLDGEWYKTLVRVRGYGFFLSNFVSE